MDAYKQLIENVAKSLKAEGVSKKGNSFYLNKNENWGVIEFQKSRDNIKPNIRFTINIGIFSSRLSAFLQEEINNKPELIRCHYRERIGFLMPQKKDVWWTLNEFENTDLLKEEIPATIRQFAIPAITERIADEDLIKAWTNNESGGKTDYIRLEYLIALLKTSLNNDTALKEAVSSLKSSENNPSTLKTLDNVLKEFKIII